MVVQKNGKKLGNEKMFPQQAHMDTINKKHYIKKKLHDQPMERQSHD